MDATEVQVASPKPGTLEQVLDLLETVVLQVGDADGFVAVVAEMLAVTTVLAQVLH